MGQKYKLIELSEEDIANLKVAYDKILNNIKPKDPFALELLTIKVIIDEFNSEDNPHTQKNIGE